MGDPVRMPVGRLLGAAAALGAVVAATMIVVTSAGGDGSVSDDGSLSRVAGAAPAAEDEGATPRSEPPQGQRISSDSLRRPPADPWRWHESGVGEVRFTDRGMSLDVADPSPDAVAHLTRPLEPAPRGVVVAGSIAVTRAGCVRQAPPTHGNVPLIRLMGPERALRVTLMRENGDCGASEELLVQAGRQYHHTGIDVALGDRHDYVLLVRTGAAGRATVALWVDGELAFRTRGADVGSRPVDRVTIGNETPGRVAGLSARDLSVAAVPGGPPPVRCSASATGPASTPGDDVLLTDDFASLRGWPRPIRLGESTAVLRPGGGGEECHVRLVSREDGVSLDRPLTDHRGPLTVELRARVVAEGGDGEHAPLVRLRTGRVAVAQLFRRNGTGEVWLALPDPDDPRRGEPTYVRTSAVVGIGAWHRYRLTVTPGAGVRVAVDGTEVLAYDAQPVGRPRRLQIGARHVGEYVVDVDDLVVREGRPGHGDH